MDPHDTPPPLAYISSLLSNRTLAEDVVHDCYVRLLEKADTYNLVRDETKLLYKAITHACIDKNYRDRRLLSLELECDGQLEGRAVVDHRPRIRTAGAVGRELEVAVTHELNRLSVA